MPPQPRPCRASAARARSPTRNAAASTRSPKPTARPSGSSGRLSAQNIPSRHVWVIDPIDGTRAFISGLPVWGTLVGLTVDGKAVAGMMSQPFTGELFYANGSGSHYEGPGGPRRLTTRKTTSLAEATLFTTTPALFKGDARQRYDRFEQQVQLARYG